MNYLNFSSLRWLEKTSYARYGPAVTCTAILWLVMSSEANPTVNDILGEPKEAFTIFGYLWKNDSSEACFTRATAPSLGSVALQPPVHIGLPFSWRGAGWFFDVAGRLTGSGSSHGRRYSGNDWINLETYRQDLNGLSLPGSMPGHSVTFKG